MASKLEFLKMMETNNAPTEEPVVDLRRQLLLSRQSTVQSVSNVSQIILEYSQTGCVIDRNNILLLFLTHFNQL